MRLSDGLYFAPNIKFSDIDITGAKLVNQFKKRICGYYLNPALESARAGHAFASGVLLVTCIDALAYYYSGTTAVGNRFINWCMKYLPSFSDRKCASLFYHNFRNGLVHNARIKDGGEFSLDTKHTLEFKDKAMSINPIRLATEVNVALNKFLPYLRNNKNMKSRFVRMISQDFNYELNN